MRFWKELKERISNTANPLSDGTDVPISIDPISRPSSPYVKDYNADPHHHILDLIGKTEGTDKARGYNETLGYGAFTGGDKNLVDMTLDQIDALQTRMLRHPKNKWNSSALGRYQIVRTTLRGLRKSMGLNGKERFTPELQDRMALKLLNWRGYQKYKSGKMTEDQFVSNLSKEWASFPTLSGGGHYAGQRAATSTGNVRNTIRLASGRA